MGFTTGLLGGFTLTTTLIYLSITLHTRNRIQQAALLHQQSFVLNNLVEPAPASPEPTAREVPAGLWETAKDKWNSELERGVKRIWSTDWDGARDQVEEGVSSVWRRTFAAAREKADEVTK
ncbi:hypothetical protein LTR78_008285 [Recurvomyces mirabilis]|uniref:MICOS complex subunit MIC12 n=1 Tax=Recurvomyces mirabilis TaxID=574656 RepID=A0AAE0TQJ7_9PEZI|nr:hypothetical protein LTR78_008285 [Recurvomyces mirabilis]KAK5156570.1 hypothetical protein LTS14_004782 [Recurvomyces mirabilis]